MVVLTAVLLIAGGIFAAAPLFKRVAKGLERLFIVLGVFVGTAVIVLTIALALSIDIFGIGPAPAADAFPYAQYTLIVMAVLGILLFSRPLRNVRWASLVALGIGILAAAYVHVAFPTASSIILAVIALVAIVIIYTLLRFVEDILEFIGTVLAFPPVAIIVGLVSIYFGIMIYAS